MSVKPLTSTLPRWANVGGDVVEPSSGKKDVGWVSAERPPAQFFNWLLTNIYLWFVWLDSGEFPKAILRNRDPDAFEQTLLAQDADGRTRLFIDGSGLPGGRVIQESFRWSPIPLAVIASQTDVDVDTRMQVTTDANTIADVIQAGGLSGITHPFPALRLRAQNAAINDAVRVHTAHGPGTLHLIADLDDLVFVSEWVATMTAVGASRVDILCGLHSAPLNALLNQPSSQAFCMFRKLSTDTNWQCVAADNNASPTVIDSTVPPVANAWQTFRIEYHGVNTPLGVENSAATVVYYIDGTQVAEISTSEVPFGTTGMALVMNARADAVGPTGDFDLNIGPMWSTWIPFLAGYDPGL